MINAINSMKNCYLITSAPKNLFSLYQCKQCYFIFVLENRNSPVYVQPYLATKFFFNLKKKSFDQCFHVECYLPKVRSRALLILHKIGGYDTLIFLLQRY